MWIDRDCKNFDGLEIHLHAEIRATIVAIEGRQIFDSANVGMRVMVFEKVLTQCLPKTVWRYKRRGYSEEN